MNGRATESRNGICPELLRMICGAALEFEFEFCCIELSTAWRLDNNEGPDD